MNIVSDAFVKAVAGDVFYDVFLFCPFFSQDVLDEIWDLIESVSEGFPTYFFLKNNYLEEQLENLFGGNKKYRLFLVSFVYSYGQNWRDRLMNTL